MAPQDVSSVSGLSPDYRPNEASIDTIPASEHPDWPSTGAVGAADHDEAPIPFEKADDVSLDTQPYDENPQENADEVVLPVEEDLHTQLDVTTACYALRVAPVFDEAPVEDTLDACEVDIVDQLFHLSRSFAHFGQEDVDKNGHKYLALPGPWKRKIHFAMSIQDGECYKVDKQTDDLTLEDAAKHWKLVEAADRKELESFNENEIFKLTHYDSVDVDPIDAVWVRKWKRMQDGSLIVKSRLCIRGFLDPQGALVPTRSSTASRFTQRLLLSLTVLFGFSLESWDVGNAFLKGFTFDQLEAAMKKRGMETLKRKVVLMPPANVWRHFRAMPNCKWKIKDDEIGLWFLVLLKAMYGLNDAPLAWQMCLEEFYLKDLKGHQSSYDDCFFMWFDHGRCVALATTHMDDNAVASSEAWLSRTHGHFVKRFGKVSRDKLPFTHCGCVYEREGSGLVMHQKTFCSQLEPCKIDKSRKDEDTLSSSEKTTYRSLLGGLLWLCVSRLDIIADTVLMQSEISAPQIKHLKLANKTIAYAKSLLPGTGIAGLHFPVLKPPLAIHTFADASHGNKQTAYAQEGIVVLLCEDRLDVKQSATLADLEAARISGRCHVLHFLSRKAKRVSYSTLHAETLSACAGKDLSQHATMRLHEVMHGAPLSSSALLRVFDTCSWIIPIDHWTVCGDFFELASGLKIIKDDKSEKLYITSFREDRLRGAIRRLYQVPTRSMVGDALTKSMQSPQVVELMYKGTFAVHNEEKHKIRVRMIPAEAIRQDYSEKDLASELSMLRLQGTAPARK